MSTIIDHTNQETTAAAPAPEKPAEAAPAAAKPAEAPAAEAPAAAPEAPKADAPKKEEPAKTESLESLQSQYEKMMADSAALLDKIADKESEEGIMTRIGGIAKRHWVDCAIVAAAVGIGVGIGCCIKRGASDTTTTTEA